MDISRVRELLRQLLGAVSTCHDSGILHRDIKPANIMLSRNNLVLGDMGLARVHFELQKLEYSHEV